MRRMVAEVGRPSSRTDADSLRSAHEPLPLPPRAARGAHRVRGETESAHSPACPAPTSLSTTTPGHNGEPPTTATTHTDERPDHHDAPEKDETSVHTRGGTGQQIHVRPHLRSAGAVTRGGIALTLRQCLVHYDSATTSNEWHACPDAVPGAGIRRFTSAAPAGTQPWCEQTSPFARRYAAVRRLLGHHGIPCVADGRATCSSLWDYQRVGVLYGLETVAALMERRWLGPVGCIGSTALRCST